MACLDVKFTPVGGDLKVVFAEVCGTGLGQYYLADCDGNRLVDSEGNYLIVTKKL